MEELEKKIKWIVGGVSSPAFVSREQYEKAINQLLELFKEEMEKIIGEDEKLGINEIPSHPEELSFRNRLRKELRNKLSHTDRKDKI